MRYDRLKIVFIILLTVSACGVLYSQQADSAVVIDSTNQTLAVVNDSLQPELPPAFTIDSISGDTIPVPQQQEGSDIQAEVKYDATDSLVFSLDGGTVELYGGAHITYQDIILEADYIRYEMDLNMVIANGVPDSTGLLAGKPVFTDANNSFKSKNLRYNFKTQKGFITEVVTEQEGGYLHSEETKKQSNGHIHIKNGKYTTCDAEHPHFYIALTKGISMPGDKIVSGPAYVVFADVPLPLGIPFGFFPNSTTKTSGILIPKYGEESRRGFYLREGGYYFAMNEYFDLRVTGDIYTNGTYGFRVGSNYKVNYKYSGNLNLKYFKNVSGYKEIEDTYSASKDYAIGWSHTQDSRANPSSSFRASVNLTSSAYDKNHTRNINSVMTNTKQSSISYSKSWPNSPFNLSASLNHTQNSNTQGVNLTLPKISLNMARINPFKRKSASGPKKWYEEIQLSYTSILENRINTIDTLLFTSSVWDDMRNGYKHNIPLSFSLKPFRKTPMLQSFAITPSLNYTGMLYSKQMYKYVDYNEINTDDVITYEAIVKDTLINKFSYAHSLFPSLSAGVAPKVYGMYNFSGEGRLEAIRHVMTPSASFSYVPDMGDIQPNYYRDVVDTMNNQILETYSIYEKQLYGTPTSNGASGSLSFNLRNNLEAKVRSKVDSIDELEKVKLLDNFNFSTSLNIFHQDTLTPAWRPISFNGSTRVLNNKLNISFRGVMDPFGNDSIRPRTRETYFSQTGKLLRLTNASASAGFSFKSKQKTNNDNPNQPGQDPESLLTNPDLTGQDMMDTYDPNMEDYYGDYVDFDIPWTMRVDYNFSYSKPKYDAKIVQTLRASGDFSLTPNWKIGFNSGYDLDKKQFTTTNLSIYRDLHCWEMRISVVPFGSYKSYNFQINAKSTILSDLKYNKRKSWQDNF